MGIRRILNSQRLWLDLAGLALSAALFVAAFHARDPIQDMLVGVATSFIFATILDMFITLQNRLADRARVHFFGAELVRKETLMCYPDFVMHDDVRATLGHHNQQMLFQRPHSRFKEVTVHRIDIPRVVAANDIQSLLYVSTAFEARRTCPLIITVDTSIIDDCARSFVSFGLSSNDCTHLYANEHADPLFTIIEDEVGSEFIRLRNGSEYRSTKRKQYGIILRYAPNPEEFPERRWLLVAGLGPVGTTATGWYLSQHWRQLAGSVPRDKNFIAVLSTGVYTDHAPHLEEICLDD
ncbi:hypothetical protein BJY16_004064 [Actinoplanes octamycinicus]|uniref:Uncharacterized protein n=1 Tax=Actinoplanes octamycinicus TaxID=135948 RepID=A0A7W7GYF5_9ACTN|nr:hypothetical protein [Actinoplanes octamycinicus]MBB4740605.1 hypothetical protein [Actinoplanes octamycinicus]GIE63093.1 hypothetical protein Aoc01nite_84950 [Actinoplanes octamycinicus]